MGDYFACSEVGFSQPSGVRAMLHETSEHFCAIRVLVGGEVAKQTFSGLVNEVRISGIQKPWGAFMKLLWCQL